MGGLRESWSFCKRVSKSKRMKGIIFSSKAPAMARIMGVSMIRIIGASGDGIPVIEFLIHGNLLLITHVNLPSIAAAESSEIQIQNGVAATLVPHRLSKEMEDSDENEAKLIELTKEIELLQKEKLELGNENREVKENIKRLTLEFHDLQNQEEEVKQELDQWEDDNVMLESLASRSADLESDISRLQHDLITSMGEIDQVNKEAAGLKRGLEEKATVIESLEKEMDDLKKEKMEIEKKERDLERKLGVLQVREIQERSKNVRIEDKMKEKIDELQKKVEALEAEAAKTRVELEKTNVEKLELEERALLLESNMLELKGVVERKTREAIKERSRDKGFKGLLLRMPVMAAGSAAVIL